MILKRRMNPKMSWPMWVTVLLLGAIVLPVAAQQPKNETAPATSADLDILQETLRNPFTAPKSQDDKTSDADKLMAERVKHLETMLGNLQEAIKRLSDAPGGSPESSDLDLWPSDATTSAARRVNSAGTSPGPAAAPTSAATGPNSAGTSPGPAAPTSAALEAYKDPFADRRVGAISKEYPLTHSEAHLLVATLTAFGNNRVDNLNLVYDREKGTASIKATAEGHRRIAALLQLLRNEGGDIHFSTNPLLPEQRREAQLRQELLLRDEQLLREKNRGSN